MTESSGYRLRLILLLLLQLATTSAAADERWQLSVTPYLWNASVSGTISGEGTGGDQSVKPDYSFFTLDNLDDYLALQIEAGHGRYGILFDTLRVRYQDTTESSPLRLHAATELGFFELTGRYTPGNNHLDLLAGVRRAFLDLDLELLPLGPFTHRAFDWTDPLIGLRYRYAMNRKWSLLARGDIGGFNVSTQRVINATFDVRYNLNLRFSFAAGYRYLDIKFKEDDFLYDVSLNGIHINATIHFH